jgi:hypothetical protein
MNVKWTSPAFPSDRKVHAEGLLALSQLAGELMDSQSIYWTSEMLILRRSANIHVRPYGSCRLAPTGSTCPCHSMQSRVDELASHSLTQTPFVVESRGAARKWFARHVACIESLLVMRS